MYEEFFGLAERPFELTPNPKYLYLFPQHREALATLKYGISTGRGLTLLLGEAGTGKTTLMRAALHETQGDTLCVSLSNPTVTRSEFVHFLADEFGLSRAAAASKVVLMRELKVLLEERRGRGATTVLLLDEAQSLPHELLEEVRLLANLETDTEKLLPVVLVGQPELSDRLNEPSLRQLKQRVAIRCTVTPLDVNAAASYVLARVRKAGGNAKIFTRDAVQQIFNHSNGIPRTINVICDNVLLAGFARAENPVTSRLVVEVCASLDLRHNGDSKDDFVGLAAPMPTTAAPEAEPAWAPVPPPRAQDDEAGLFDAVARAWRVWRP